MNQSTISEDKPQTLELLGLAPAQAQAIQLMLQRMSFDDFLKLTDGDGDEDQAYFFIEASANLRRALDEAA